MLPNLRKVSLNPVRSLRTMGYQGTCRPLATVTSLSATFCAHNQSVGPNFGACHTLSSMAPNLRELRISFDTPGPLAACATLSYQWESMDSLERIEFRIAHHCKWCENRRDEAHHERFCHNLVLLLIQTTLYLKLKHLRRIRVVFPSHSELGQPCTVLRDHFRAWVKNNVDFQPAYEPKIFMSDLTALGLRRNPFSDLVEATRDGWNITDLMLMSEHEWANANRKTCEALSALGPKCS